MKLSPVSLSSDRKHLTGDWSRVLATIPPLAGQTVLDMGCGEGDQAAVLAARGARVIGIDMNGDAIAKAKSRGLAHADFRKADLRRLGDLGIIADGLWCSFAAAYFPDFSNVLRSWIRHLKPGAWIAVTEIDDLFGHEPLAPWIQSLFAAYANEAQAAGRYDFYMGRKLRDCLEQCGCAVTTVLCVSDPEFAFSGPASPETIEAWRARFARMPLLQEFCGTDFEPLLDQFLDCITRPDHRSTAKVCCCLAAVAGA